MGPSYVSEPISDREKALNYAFQASGYNGVQDIDALLINAEKFLVFLEGDEIND